LKVKEQVCDLAKTIIVQSALKNGQKLSLHGWSYDLNSGFVADLNVNISSDYNLIEFIN
jgi:carbonic anhydrase